MASVRFEDFGGIAPGITPARLPDMAATKAHNCRIRNGRLEPLRQPTQDQRRINFEGGLSEIADAKSIYLWHKSDGTDEWIAWAGRVKVAPSNLAIDNNSRLFVTGQTGYTDSLGNTDAPVMYFDKSVGYSKYPIIKPMLKKPEAKRVNELDPDKTIRYTYFFQTWVDQYGYESPVSPNSDEVEYNDGQLISIDELLITSELANAVKRRVYKVITGTETEQIQFIAEQDRVGARFLTMYFNVKDEDAGEVLEQITAPPASLSDIVWMPNSFYAGVDRATKRTICFSDVNLPYSFPLAYQYTVKDDIVGIAVTGSSLAVLTTGSPWLISGTAPEAMSATSLNAPYACVSADSICTLSNTVYYASHGGICALAEGSTEVAQITKTWFGTDEWQKLHPETCMMVAHDGALHLWFDGSEGYVIDLSAPSAIKAITTNDERASCVYEDVTAGKLCYVRRTEEGE